MPGVRHIRPPKRLGAARKRFVVGVEHTSRWRCSACSSEGRQHRGSCKHFRTRGGNYTVPTIQSSLLSLSDEEDVWQQTAQFGSSDGASRRTVLATGRDFCEDGVGDDEELCMSSPSSESIFAGDNLDEAAQMAAAQVTTGGSTVVMRSMTRRASEAQNGTREGGSS